VSSHEHSKGPSGSIRGSRFLTQLRNYLLLRTLLYGVSSIFSFHHCTKLLFLLPQSLLFLASNCTLDYTYVSRETSGYLVGSKQLTALFQLQFESLLI
jgi:hypothetical protein